MSVYSGFKATLTSLLTRLLFTLLHVTDLLGGLVHWIFWPGNVEWTKFDKVLSCDIDGEITHFLHDSALWDGNI